VGLVWTKTRLRGVVFAAFEGGSRADAHECARCLQEACVDLRDNRPDLSWLQLLLFTKQSSAKNPLDQAE